jgi:catalase
MKFHTEEGNQDWVFNNTVRKIFLYRLSNCVPELYEANRKISQYSSSETL